MKEAFLNILGGQLRLHSKVAGFETETIPFGHMIYDGTFCIVLQFAATPTKVSYSITKTTPGGQTSLAESVEPRRVAYFITEDMDRLLTNTEIDVELLNSAGEVVR